MDELNQKLSFMDFLGRQFEGISRINRNLMANRRFINSAMIELNNELQKKPIDGVTSDNFFHYSIECMKELNGLLDSPVEFHDYIDKHKNLIEILDYFNALAWYASKLDENLSVTDDEGNILKGKEAIGFLARKEAEQKRIDKGLTIAITDNLNTLTVTDEDGNFKRGREAITLLESRLDTSLHVYQSFGVIDLIELLGDENRQLMYEGTILEKEDRQAVVDMLTLLFRKAK